MGQAGRDRPTGSSTTLWTSPCMPKLRSGLLGRPSTNGSRCHRLTTGSRTGTQCRIVSKRLGSSIPVGLICGPLQRGTADFLPVWRKRPVQGAPAQYGQTLTPTLVDACLGRGRPARRRGRLGIAGLPRRGGPLAGGRWGGLQVGEAAGDGDGGEAGGVAGIGVVGNHA